VESSRQHLRHRLADERGQDAIEYAGALVLVAAIVAVVLFVVGTLTPGLTRDVECAIDQIFGSSCSSPVYAVSQTVKTAGWNGRALIVDGGHDYTLALTKYNNGTATITVNNVGNIGVSAQIGADVEAGPGFELGANASAGIGGYGQKSNTWRFQNWAQAQKAFNGIAQGSGLGLASHDAAQSACQTILPFGLGCGTVTHLWDSVTGSQGAPGSSSLPHKNLYSSSVSAGVQGSADAGADAGFGPLSAGVKAAVDAHAGLGHVSYGPDKGDWQLLGGLDGTATGHLSEDLFGGTAEGQGTINGDVTVLFSPNGTPKELEVTASGDGVWHVAPPSGLNPRLPDSIKVKQPEGGAGSGSGSPEGGSSQGGGSSEGSKEPLLDFSSDSSEGSGYGSEFSGTLDLSAHPQAEQDLGALLRGDPTKIDALVNDMNTSGEERVWNYKVNRSDSSYGASGNFVVGAAGHVSDGTATMQDSPPEMREDGGRWHSAAGSP
jgi:Flp pilus assembly pilin Flp